MMLDVERLDETCIKKLANEEVLAIRLRGFLPEPLAIRIGDKILAPGFEGYINAPSIGRIGMAFYEAENQPLLIEDYFERATSNIAELRQDAAMQDADIGLAEHTVHVGVLRDARVDRRGNEFQIETMIPSGRRHLPDIDVSHAVVPSRTAIRGRLLSRGVRTYT